MTTWAVILAGGAGRRLGSALPKQLLPLDDRTVLEHSVAAFADHPAIDRVLVVAPADHHDAVATLVGDLADLVTGGAERTDSTRAGLEAIAALGGADDDLVLVHDAARPLVPARVVADVVDALRVHPAVATLVDTADTIVRVDPATGGIVEMLPRHELRRHQTPQGFHVGVLAAAHRAAVDEARAGGAAAVTDDCSLVQRHRPDLVVATVSGDPANLKITDATDLVVARALLAAREG